MTKGDCLITVDGLAGCLLASSVELVPYLTKSLSRAAESPVCWETPSDFVFSSLHNHLIDFVSLENSN